MSHYFDERTRDLQEQVQRLVADRSELVTMLHELFAVAVDRGGYSEEEGRLIEDKAEALLAKHGVRV